MDDRIREFAWFVVVSVGVLVTGTVAIAIPVSRLSMCSEMKAGVPPTCHLGAVPDIWLQTYQAMMVAIVLWIGASVALPVLLAFVTRRPKYLSMQILWLIVACISGLGAGDWWTERQYPESYWENSSSAIPTALGIVWTVLFSWGIIEASIKKITSEEVRYRFPTT